MIHRLIATTIVLAMGIILVSPCADIDDAVHQHSHHHHVSVSPHESALETVTIDDNSPVATEKQSLIVGIKLTVSALRC